MKNSILSISFFSVLFCCCIVSGLEPTSSKSKEKTKQEDRNQCNTHPPEKVKLPSDEHCRGMRGMEKEMKCRYSHLRCHPNEKDCEPIPYGKSRYEKEKERMPFPGNPDPGRNGCLNRGSCTHDGECITNGCGAHCTSYKVAHFSGICPEYPELKKAFCGCVKNRCTWFLQP